MYNKNQKNYYQKSKIKSSKKKITGAELKVLTPKNY